MNIFEATQANRKKHKKVTGEWRGSFHGKYGPNWVTLRNRGGDTSETLFALMITIGVIYLGWLYVQ